MNSVQKHVKMAIVLFLLALLTLACKDDGTTQPPTPERVKLTLIDVSVKETFLHIAVTNAASNETLSLQRNGTTVITFAAVADTNIMDTALTQTTTYQYRASLTKSNSVTGTSNTVSAQTLAPTSHNFTWQTFLLGDGNNSALYDVAVIGDSLIYAVGELYLRDSTGAIGDTPYNLTIWDGIRWDIRRLNFQGFPPVVRFVFAVNARDVWLDPWFHWDGQQFSELPIAPVFNGTQWNRMWGSSDGRLYVVGNGGNIAYSPDDHSTWQRLASGTTTNILDALGVVNPVTGKEEVYCAASSFFDLGAEKKIVRITERTHVDSIAWINRLLSGVWTNAGYPIYTSGDGLFENKSGAWREIPTGIYTNDIRGTGLNNIIAVGDVGFITHYNGIEWQTVASDVDAGYATVRLNGNLVCAVGRKSGRAIITMGRRN